MPHVQLYGVADLEEDGRYQLVYCTVIREDRVRETME
jgi:hypothetical protein